MPPLPSVAVPVISVSEQTDQQFARKGKQAIKPTRRGRIYEDGPLPVKPSDLAPRSAQIVERDDNDGVPRYRLRIGDTEIGDVALAEILDYVSALELETFENRKFLEEREILKIVAAEEQREAEEEKRLEKQRRKFKAKTKGTVFYESFDEADSGVSNPAGGTQIATGRNGRPRPTYTHLYKLPKERRRRKRDPQTGELISLSGDEQAMESSGDDLALAEPSSISANPQDSLVLPNKRPRRRRHPVTKELMPLGWRYDPNEGEGSSTGQLLTGDETSFLRGLTISEEPSAKRPKLDLGVVLPAPSQQQQQAVLGPSSVASFLSQRQLGKVTSPKPQQPQNVQDEDVMIEDSSSDPVAPTSITRPSAATAKTSITNPSAVNDPILPTTADELSDGSTDGDEYDIDSILAHSMSNPKTHPPGLGDDPVMLYQVKWQGFEDPTWEPLESFGDIGIVNAYHQRNGLKPPQSNTSSSADHGDDVAEASTNPHPPIKAQRTDRKAGKYQQPQTSMVNPSVVPNDLVEASDDDLEEDEYEVEQILSHRLSDPRTHPAGLGRHAVMLYQVKWKGYDEMTWEPAYSFEGDLEMIGAYRRKAGLDG